MHVSIDGIRPWGLPALFVAALLPGAAAAHGVVGARSFIEPFITEDVNPKNEFVIARPEWDHAHDGHALLYGFALEKKLANRFSLALDSKWARLDPGGPDRASASGFLNLGITLKYAFFVDPEREAILSAALESTAPTGAGDVGAERGWSFTPRVLYGKGLGDLPRSIALLRPLAVQGEAGAEVSADRGATTVVAHDVAFEYSVPYLQSAVRDVGLRWPLDDLIPVVELNFEHAVNGAASGTSRIFATPGIVYMDRWVEVGMAGRFPLNGGARDELDWGLIWIVDLFIDDVFPWTRWQPLGGRR